MAAVPIELRDANGAGTTAKLYDGVPFSSTVPDDVEKFLNGYNGIEYGEKDVYVISYPKSGTHWTHEIIHMLLNGSTEYFNDMPPLIGFHGKKDIEAKPSPRIINSHLLSRHMPQDAFQKRIKMVHVYRNPKDVAVSYFNFLQKLKMGNYRDCTFASFLPMYIEGKVLWGSWDEYLKDWIKYTEDHPDYPILMISYEEMKTDLKGCVKRIAEFLETKTSDDLIGDIAEKCQFQNMFAEKMQSVPKKVTMITDANTHIFYRKGQVGDWKNWFTVAESENFDAVLGSKIASLNLEIKFTMKDK